MTYGINRAWEVFSSEINLHEVNGGPRMRVTGFMFVPPLPDGTSGCHVWVELAEYNRRTWPRSAATIVDNRGVMRVRQPVPDDRRTRHATEMSLGIFARDHLICSNAPPLDTTGGAAGTARLLDCAHLPQDLYGKPITACWLSFNPAVAHVSGDDTGIAHLWFDHNPRGDARTVITDSDGELLWDQPGAAGAHAPLLERMLAEIRAFAGGRYRLEDHRELVAAAVRDRSV